MRVRMRLRELLRAVMLPAGLLRLRVLQPRRGELLLRRPSARTLRTPKQLALNHQ
jgi:hypothetical protein